LMQTKPLKELIIQAMHDAAGIERLSDEELKKVLEMIEVMENGEATKDERGNQRDGDVEEHGERATTEIDKTQGAPQSLAEDRISEDRISEDRIEANPVQPPRRHR